MTLRPMPYYTYQESPIKQLLLVSNGQDLTGLYFIDHRCGKEIQLDWEKVDSVAPFPQVRAQLAAYFAGELSIFVPVFCGSTM